MKAYKTLTTIITVSVLAFCVAHDAFADARGKQDSSPPAQTEGVVNINTATAEQLALLPGVGPSKAEAIIRARERRPFRNINEIVRVRGIGRATLVRLRPYLTVSGETTLARSIPMRRNGS